MATGIRNIQHRSKTTLPLERHELSKKTRLFRRFTCSVFASVGIFGGISSAVAGLFCAIIHSLVSGDTAFGQAGTALLIAALPAMLIGSLFMDEIEG